jgi:hypothetical protein
MEILSCYLLSSHEEDLEVREFEELDSCSIFQTLNGTIPQVVTEYYIDDSYLYLAIYAQENLFPYLSVNI